MVTTLANTSKLIYTPTIFYSNPPSDGKEANDRISFLIEKSNGNYLDLLRLADLQENKKLEDKGKEGFALELSIGCKRGIDPSDFSENKGDLKSVQVKIGKNGWLVKVESMKVTRKTDPVSFKESSVAIKLCDLVLVLKIIDPESGGERTLKNFHIHLESDPLLQESYLKMEEDYYYIQDKISSLNGKPLKTITGPNKLLQIRRCGSSEEVKYGFYVPARGLKKLISIVDPVFYNNNFKN